MPLKIVSEGFLVDIDIFQRLGDRLFFGLFQELLKFCLQHLRLVLLGFDNLLILLVAAGSFFFDKLGGVSFYEKGKVERLSAGI